MKSAISALRSERLARHWASMAPEKATRPEPAASEQK
jgi:hypothetical protein